MPLQTDERPRKFVDVVGNEETVEALKKIVTRGDKPHAYIFTGPSGCGKTTLAYILAKKLKAFGADFKEMNSADYRGIDGVREIRSQFRLKPIHSKSKSKVFFWDECHKLTPEAQEAMLKLLEKPPPNVYSILATTNPEKLKKTFLRRCTPFVLEELDEDCLVAYMKKLLVERKVKVPSSILENIAEQAGGSIGYALMVLDKIMDLEPEQMKKELKKIEAEEKLAESLAQTLLKSGKWKPVAQVLKTIDTDNVETIRYKILAYMNTVLLNSGKVKAYQIIEAFSEPFYNAGKAGLTKACFEALNLDG